MRGRPSQARILELKNNKVSMTKINISIPLSLLTAIEQNVKGASRNEKLLACVRAGYETLVGERALPPSSIPNPSLR